MSISNKAASDRTHPGIMRSRREFLSRTAGGIAFLGATGTGMLTRDENKDFKEKPAPGQLKIVVTGGHPGDPEYGCGGTIARYTELGHEVVLLYLNRGEAGINGKSAEEASKIRTSEALQACWILRARAVFASQTDGQTIVDADRYREFYDLLAREQPDIIFTQWPIDNHPDHRALTTLVYNAWQRLKESNPSRHTDLYYYEVSNGEDTLMFTPTCYVDITSVESIKRKACLAHTSQSPDKFYPLQEQVSGFRGLESGCKLAEAFILQVHPLQVPL
jgi:N-acetylglucosamine malate deacetylase 1